MRRIRGPPPMPIRFVAMDAGVPDKTSPPRDAPLTGYQLVFAPVKNGKERDVPVADEVILKLSAHLAAIPARPLTLPRMRPDGKLDGDLTRKLLFTNDGRPWYNGTVHRPWNQAWRAAGVPEAPQITAGMSFAAASRASACPAASAWPRPRNCSATPKQAVVLATYSHFMPQDEDRARDILNGFFAPRNRRADAPRMPSASGEGSLCLVSGVLPYFCT
jgi:hypothetical protein